MCSFQFLGYDKKTFNIEKFYMDTLNKEYNNYDFKQISSIISEIENNVFISIIQRKSIINLYYKNLRLKWLLTKKIIRYRNSNIEKEPINKYLLDLTSSLEPSSKYIDVLINKNKFHRFTINEMIQLFEFSLYSQEEGIPNPSIPNNPYTGNSFTLLEMIHIFNIIKQQNQELPLVMSMFKHSRFDIHNMLKLNKVFFVLKSSECYIHDLDEDEWLTLFNLYYKYEGLKDFTCKKCMLKNPEFRLEFSNILIKYIFESNIDLDEQIEPTSIKMCIHFIDYYKIPYGKKHNAITHRRVLKVKQNKKILFKPYMGGNIDIDFYDYKKDELFIFGKDNI